MIGGVGEMDREEGLKEFVALPVKAARGHKINVAKQYAKMGLIFGGLLGQDKVKVQLPEGWTVDNSPGGVWRGLIDDKGRVRARYFLSTNTGSSFIVFGHRYDHDLRPFDNYEDKTVTDVQRRLEDWFGVITDCGEEIARTEPYKSQTIEEFEQVMPEILRQRCEDYLREHFPDWEDVNAYWD